MIKQFATETFVYKNYIELTEEENRKIWKGRNHPEIRKFMTNSEPFPFESHLAYVERLRSLNDRIYYAVVWNDDVIASICLNPYNSEKKRGKWVSI